MTEQAQSSSVGLRHFPVALFAVVMGLWGWSMAMAAGAAFAPWLLPVADGLRLLATLVFIIISGFYLAKLCFAFEGCREEWKTPARLAFFPAMSISVLLLATAYLDVAPAVAAVAWPIGAGLQGVLTLAVISSWISSRSFETAQLSPAWFVPAVGNVVVPIAGVPLGYVDLSWLFFSGGLVFWVVLLTLVVNRLMFHDPMPGKLLPTLVILVAPPAVGFLAYLELSGGVLDGFAQFLMSVAFVFALLVLIQAPKFRGLPFALSWWALSFPIAGLSSAAFVFAGLDQSVAHIWIGALALVLLSCVVFSLLVLTVRAFLRGVFFLPE